MSNRTVELTPFPNYAYYNFTQDTIGGGADLFLDFIINNLKPYIDTIFRTRPERENTGIMGFSFGGLFSFYAGLKRQDVFSKIGVFSASFWFNENIIFNWTMANLPRYKDMRLFMTVGSLEDSSTPIGFENMTGDMLKMASMLKAYGYGSMVNSSIIPNGRHYCISWQTMVPTCFNWLFQ